MVKKIIVTTTINAPTEALYKFAQLQDWQLIVVGDKKTPANFKLERSIYLTPEMQEKFDQELSDAIGWNCIQRRNFGLLWAYNMGAEIIAMIDDDNIPKENWGDNLLLGKPFESNFFETDDVAFDPVGATNHSNLWHRGFPLQLLPTRNYSNCSRKTLEADIQADFWDGDPDIDALCRMIHAPKCEFDVSYFPISANRMAPFNSQNTFLMRSVLKDFFLFPHIGRMDDIWAAYYVQAKGYRVVFGAASVFQLRNPRDPINDMKAEYMGYENNLKIVQEIPADPDLIVKYLPRRSWDAFQLYKRHFKT